ncbi:MAG: putative toxin-antitoxin system toxin component, PIN family [Cyclobacteriaceae bacterium]
MSLPKKFVFDTNALISAALLKNSVSAKAYDHAVSVGTIAISDMVLDEFIEVLFRKKLDRYFLTEEERLEPIRFLETKASKFEIKERITDCKDPDDNMILELAVAANASCIITGDKKHLISLHPFRGIPILTPADFLKVF